MTIKVFCYTHASIHFTNVKKGELLDLNLLLSLLEKNVFGEVSI